MTKRVSTSRRGDRWPKSARSKALLVGASARASGQALASGDTLGSLKAAGLSVAHVAAGIKAAVMERTLPTPGSNPTSDHCLCSDFERLPDNIQQRARSPAGVRRSDIATQGICKGAACRAHASALGLACGFLVLTSLLR